MSLPLTTFYDSLFVELFLISQAAQHSQRDSQNKKVYTNEQKKKKYVPTQVKNWLWLQFACFDSGLCAHTKRVLSHRAACTVNELPSPSGHCYKLACVSLIVYSRCVFTGPYINCSFFVLFFFFHFKCLNAGFSDFSTQFFFSIGVTPFSLSIPFATNEREKQ